MAWPTGSISTTHMDADTDSPLLARPAIKLIADLLNQILAHGEPALKGGSAAQRFKVGAPAAADEAARLETVTAHTGAAAPHSGHETPTGAQARVDAHANITWFPHGATSASMGNRIAARTPEGDLVARNLRSESTSGGLLASGYFLGQNAVGAGADNYARPTPLNSLFQLLGATASFVEDGYIALPPLLPGGHRPIIQWGYLGGNTGVWQDKWFPVVFPIAVGAIAPSIFHISTDAAVGAPMSIRRVDNSRFRYAMSGGSTNYNGHFIAIGF